MEPTQQPNNNEYGNQTQGQPVKQAAVGPTPVNTETMSEPAMLELVKAGWQFVLLRMDIVGWYVALLVVAGVLSSDWLRSMSELTTFTASIASLVIMIFVAINSWAIIYAVSQPDPSVISFKMAFDWAAKHFFPLLWTTILVSLAVMFGIILLIIPGIILMVYLYFSLYAVAMGHGSGVTALKRSYHDVKGRWWAVAKKLLALMLWILLIYIAVGIVYGLLVVFAGEGGFAMMVIDALSSGIIGGAVGVISMYALAQYYKYLRATQPTEPAQPAQPTQPAQQ